MSPLMAMFYVILPQACKNIIPEMANTFLTNLKMTSVLNVIGVSELFMMAKTAGGTYYKYFEAYLVIALIYFVLCFVFNRLFLLGEKKLAGKKDYVLAVEYMNEERGQEA
jgi:putative lysine transport system permease protein